MKRVIVDKITDKYGNVWALRKKDWHDKVKYLILLSSVEKEPYIMMENTIRDTWAKNINDYNKYGLYMLYYYAISGRNEILNDKLYVNAYDNFEEAGLYAFDKVIATFEKALTFKNMKCVFFVNVSSYIQVNKLLKIFETCQDKMFYSGLLHKHNFIQGAGFFLSRDLIKLLVDNRYKLNRKLMTDKSLSDFYIRQFGIKPICQQVPWLRKIGLTFNREYIDKYYHLRCRSKRGRQHDAALIRYIHKLLNESI